MNEAVTSDNYSAYAGVTENVPRGPVGLSSEKAFALAMALNSMQEVSMQLDRIKKHLFYGAPLDFRDVLEKLPQVRYSGKPIVDLTLDVRQVRLLHAALGMLTEAAEFSEDIGGNIFQGTPIDETHMKEELGDECWYMSIPMRLFGWTWTDVMAVNIEKLRRRYPQGFTSEKAINRNLEAERQALESAPATGAS